jgi:hypothetical protein
VPLYIAFLAAGKNIQSKAVFFKGNGRFSARQVA